MKSIGLDKINGRTWEVAIQGLPMLKELHVKNGPYIEDLCKILNEQQQFETLIIDITDDCNERFDQNVEGELAYDITMMAKKNKFTVQKSRWSDELDDYTYFQAIVKA